MPHSLIGFRDGRPLRITNEVAEAIERQRDLVKDVTDHFGAQVDFFRNVVVASRTKGKRNRDFPMDVLDERVRAILFNLCQNMSNEPSLRHLN